MLIDENDVPVAALPIDAFKAHLRLGTGFGTEDIQDSVLEGFLRAAIAAIEARIGKALIARSFVWTVSQWHDDYGAALPIAPVSAIVSVERVDQFGMASTVSADVYRLVADLHVPELRATGFQLPSPPVAGAIRVTLTAGFAAEWTEVPADLAQAVMMLATHYYENRAATSLGAGCMPFGVTSLLERYRRLRISAGGAS